MWVIFWEVANVAVAPSFKVSSFDFALATQKTSEETLLEDLEWEEATLAKSRGGPMRRFSSTSSAVSQSSRSTYATRSAPSAERSGRLPTRSPMATRLSVRELPMRSCCSVTASSSARGAGVNAWLRSMASPRDPVE